MLLAVLRVSPSLTILAPPKLTTKTLVKRGRSSFRIFLLLASAILFLPGDPAVQAQTWTDSSGNHRWSKSQNWVSHQTPANDGSANIVFGPSSFTDSILDANWSVNSIDFNNSATAFIISGSQLTIQGGGIIVSGSASETFNNAIVLGAAQTWDAGNGGLNFGGSVNNGGFDLTIDGSGSTTISGSISGTGGLIKNGLGTLTLSGANPISGSVTINAGTLFADGNGSLGSVAGVSVNSGGTLSLGGTDPINRVNNTAIITLNGGALAGNNKTESFGVLNLRANSTISLTSGGPAGTLTFWGGTRAGGTLTISGWSGTAGTSGTDDHVVFSSDPGSQFLQNVTFSGFDPGALWLGNGEIVPVPEPGVALLLVLGMASLAMRSLKQIQAGVQAPQRAW